MLVQVLGPGCAKCKEAENLVRSVAKSSGLPVSVEKVSDLREMMALGVLSTPAVVIDHKIMCAGHVPTKAEVLDWLQQAAEGAL